MENDDDIFFFFFVEPISVETCIISERRRLADHWLLEMSAICKVTLSLQPPLCDAASEFFHPSHHPPL